MVARRRVSLKVLGSKQHRLPTSSFPGRGKTSTPKAERSDGPSEAPHPSGCAEERRAKGGQEHCKMLLLRELACGSCLNVESEANKVSSAAPPFDRAPQVARSAAQGHGKWGRLFCAYCFLAKQKRVGAPPGAIPGLRPQEKSRRQFTTAALKSTAACPHPRPLPEGEGVKTTAACPHAAADRPRPLPQAGERVKPSARKTYKPMSPSRVAQARRTQARPIAP